MKKQVLKLFVAVIVLAPLASWSVIFANLLYPHDLMSNFSGEVEQHLKLSRPDVFRLAVLGDSRRNIEVLETILQDAAPKSDAAVIIGDLVDLGNWQSLRFVKMEVRETAPDLPVFTGLGNHDLDGARAGDTFRECFGPDHYWLRFGKVVFIMINNCEDQRWEKELVWLEQTMKERVGKDDRLFLMMHKPPYLGPEVSGISEEKSEQLLKLIRPLRGRVVILASHVHSNLVGEMEGIPVYITGEAGAPQNADSPAYGYLQLDCDRHDCTITHVPIKTPESSSWEEHLVIRKFWALPLSSLLLGVPVVAFPYFRKSRRKAASKNV